MAMILTLLFRGKITYIFLLTHANLVLLEKCDRFTFQMTPIGIEQLLMNNNNNIYIYLGKSSALINYYITLKKLRISHWLAFLKKR